MVFDLYSPRIFIVQLASPRRVVVCAMVGRDLGPRRVVSGLVLDGLSLALRGLRPHSDLGGTLGPDWRRALGELCGGAPGGAFGSAMAYAQSLDTDDCHRLADRVGERWHLGIR